MTHYIKILPKYFKHVKCNRKNFELRKNDRDYKSGDTLVLREWDNGYTGRQVTRHVSYVLYGPAYGLEDGYCIMGFRGDYHLSA